ncbi:MAG: hypothetical protein ACI35V_03220 [Sphingobacterium composti]|uniref:hypothetical protein n=1 Tax=Sphingobacterium composti TaxID=363260 RepID=UPI00135860A5|nr:hypothetical protein [Sphingobacterium composti Ten et al. 2007 non Yoo et al. 2007]
MKALTNPFEIYRESKLLIIGIAFAIVAALVSCYTNHLIFGSLKVISNHRQLWYEGILNISITLLSNTLIMYIFARLRYVKTRFIDVLNVVLISHLVTYVMLILTVLPPVQNAITAVELEVLDKGFSSLELSKIHMVILGAFGVCVIALLIYFFYLLVVGMKIAMNSKRKIDVLLIILLVFVWNTILQFLNPYL